MELILVLAPNNKISVHTNTPVGQGDKVNINIIYMIDLAC